MLNGFTCSAFDLLHAGHVEMLRECKEHCDFFQILLHEDPSIERPEKLKPIVSIEDRLEMLMSLKSIDHVLTYKTEKELYKILKDGYIDVRFLGDDYIGKTFTGGDLDIPIHYLNRDHGWSTTKYKQLIGDSICGTK